MPKAMSGLCPIVGIAAEDIERSAGVVQRNPAPALLDVAAARHELNGFCLKVGCSLFRALDLGTRGIRLVVHHDVDLLGLLERNIAEGSRRASPPAPRESAGSAG